MSVRARCGYPACPGCLHCQPLMGEPKPRGNQSTIRVGQYDPELTAYCDDCRANVRAYWVRKDSVPVAAFCPVQGHNRPLKIQPAELQW